MGFPELAAWSVILGLSLMLIGGLVLWAYGTRSNDSIIAIGPEAEATKNFHGKLVRWFFMYGIMVIVIGACLIFWVASVFL